MSELQQESSQPVNGAAPPPEPPVDPPPAPAVELGRPSSDAPPASAPPQDPPPTGGDGNTPEPVAWDKDWRAATAGEDQELLSELSRIQVSGKPEDVARHLAQENLRQKRELSKRAVSGAYPKEGTEPEQQAWREANGVPKEGTLEAYGVKPPEGVELGEVDTAALGEYAASMHAMGVTPDVVKATTDHYFQMQEANQQALNALDNERETAWDGELNEMFGNDRNLMCSAAEACLEQMIPDATLRAEFANARLASGGKMSMHPGFLKILASAADQRGLTDRIEANSSEASSGKTLMEERSEIMALINTNPAEYDRKQERLGRLSELLISRGEMDQFGNIIRKA